MPPELPISVPPRPRARSMPPELQISIPPRPAPAVCLPNSRCLEANTSTSPRPQHASRTPDLLRQKEATPAAHLQSSRALEANTSTYLRVTRPTAFLPSPRSLETKRGNTPAALLQTSCISRPAACLLSSRSPYLHVPAPAACLPS